MLAILDSLLYLLSEFFTHKDFLPEASLLPGTLFTPLHLVFEAIVLLFVISAAIYVSKRSHLIKPIFTVLLVALVIFEVVIILWDSFAGRYRNFDLTINLPLYPCSIFMYVLPFIIWGKGLWKEAACGYVCTLGLVGALINFLYPIARLLDYSCISFAAFHTFFFHGSMLFASLVLILSGTHRYGKIHAWWSPFLASIPGLIMSIPANIINFSPIRADYMYFTGQHFLSKMVFGNCKPLIITLVMYLAYLFGPALFYYIPWLVHRLFAKKKVFF